MFSKKSRLYHALPYVQASPVNTPRTYAEMSSTTAVGFTAIRPASSIRTASGTAARTISIPAPTMKGMIVRKVERLFLAVGILVVLFSDEPSSGTSASASLAARSVGAHLFGGVRLYLAAQLEVAGEPLWGQRSLFHRVTYGAAGFSLVGAVAEAAGCRQRLYVGKGGRQAGLRILDGQSAQARGVDEGAAAGQYDQLSSHGRVPASGITFAYGSDPLDRRAHQTVDQGGFTDSRRADQGDGPIAARVGFKYVEPHGGDRAHDVHRPI